jgi:hypothetical protein
MYCTDLRNNVEHIAATVRQGKTTTDEEANAVAAEAILTFGQVAVGIFEELAGIHAALDELNAEHARSVATLHKAMAPEGS